MLNRRGLLLGLASSLAAPSIVRATSLMPIKAITPIYDWLDCNGQLVSCRDYGDLFRVIRYAYGGEGSAGRFMIPDLGRVMARGLMISARTTGFAPVGTIVSRM